MAGMIMGVEMLKNNKRKIRRTSVVDQVYEAIRQNILDGIWKPEDKLPSESELADFYGVNRLSVRMALQKLNTLGITETRVGEGSFVSNFSLQPFLNEVAPIYTAMDNRRDVAQMRNLLEGECMNIAIVQATEEQKSALKEKLDYFQECRDRYLANVDNRDNLEVMVNADFAFHYEIICISGNQLYMDVYNFMKNAVCDHIRHLIYMRVHSETPQEFVMHDNHRIIYECIMNGDVLTAKQNRESMLGIVPRSPDYYAGLTPEELDSL